MDAGGFFWGDAYRTARHGGWGATRMTMRTLSGCVRVAGLERDNIF